MSKGIQLCGRVESNNNTGFNLLNSFFYRYTKKILAFTLAETLIVMGIIGVVAALTIPNLNSSTGNAEKMAKVKKIYAELNEAQNRAIAVYGPLNAWFINDGCEANLNCAAARTRYFDRITEFMKITKNCGTTGSGCMANNYKFLYGNTDQSYDSTSYARGVLSGGWSFSIIEMITQYSTTEFSGYKTNGSAGTIFVDIDGPNKGKNTWGVDLFWFLVTTDGIYPYGGGTRWTDTGYWNLKQQCFYYGKMCAAWVINTGNMDYLDASHEESTAGKCNNSDKVLSTTVTSCK